MSLTIIGADAIHVRAYGRPAPKGSQIAMKTKAGKAYTRSASKYEAPWINAVRDATRNAMRHATPIEAPYRIELVFYQAKPKAPAKDWPTANDLDKLARATIDGLVRGKAISDDRHVVDLHARKEYVADPDEAGVLAIISPQRP